MPIIKRGGEKNEANLFVYSFVTTAESERHRRKGNDFAPLKRMRILLFSRINKRGRRLIFSENVHREVMLGGLV